MNRNGSEREQWRKHEEDFFTDRSKQVYGTQMKEWRQEALVISVEEARKRYYDMNNSSAPIEKIQRPSYMVDDPWAEAIASMAGGQAARGRSFLDGVEAAEKNRKAAAAELAQGSRDAKVIITKLASDSHLSASADNSYSPARRGAAQGDGDMAFPSFSTLWNNYPGMNADGTYAHPSSNPAYRNQCAIRMSDCLIKSGVSLTGYPKDDLDKDYGKWALTANRLKFYLSQKNKNFVRVSQDEFESKYWNQTGIIYIAPPPGGIGHIDLFNRGVTGSGKGGPPGAGYYLGSEIWFWNIK
jgi:hypothetical protein